MSQVIGQVWREVVGCRNWPVMRVPQFIALRRNACNIAVTSHEWLCVSNHRQLDGCVTCCSGKQQRKHWSSAWLQWWPLRFASQLASDGETHSMPGILHTLSLQTACTARKITNTCLTRGRHQIETFIALLALCSSNSLQKGQWRGTLIFPLICFSTSGWVSNRDAGDLRRNCPHYDGNLFYHRGNVLSFCQGLFLLRFLYPAPLTTSKQARSFKISPKLCRLLEG